MKALATTAAGPGFLGQMKESISFVTTNGAKVALAPVTENMHAGIKGTKAFAGVGIGVTSLVEALKDFRNFSDVRAGGFNYKPATYSAARGLTNLFTAFTTLGWFAGAGLSKLGHPAAKALGAALQFIPGKLPAIPLASFLGVQAFDQFERLSQGTATTIDRYATWGAGARKLHRDDPQHGGTSPLLPAWNYGRKLDEKILGLKTHKISLNRKELDNFEVVAKDYLYKHGVYKNTGITGEAFEVEV